jgi:colanic acid biosynthesis glycosyl transferase WcaI
VRVLLLAGNYSPELTASAPLTTDFARYMRDAGHEVSVVTTFPHYPQWKRWKGYEGLYRCEALDGVTVRRIKHYIPTRPTPAKRIAYHGTFSFGSLAPALLSGRADVILCVTPPLELAISAWILRLIWGVPQILWIKDLVPDVAIQLGMLRNRAAIIAGRGLEQFAYKTSQKLLVICESFRNNICRKGVPPEKLVVIPDWVDVRAIDPGRVSGTFRGEHAISPGKFLALHAGNIGAKQKLELVVHAAKLLEQFPEIEFLIVGEGARKFDVMAEAERLGVRNVRFLPLQPESQFAEMLGAANVLILHQQRQVSDSVIPSKLLKYMASGRPIVATAAPDSETASTVFRSGCGELVEPESPDKLAAAILRLYRNDELARRHGAAGRRFVCENFSRHVVLRRIEILLCDIAAKSPSAPLISELSEDANITGIASRE